jgi:hypothetical protein
MEAQAAAQKMMRLRVEAVLEFADQFVLPQ